MVSRTDGLLRGGQTAVIRSTEGWPGLDAVSRSLGLDGSDHVGKEVASDHDVSAHRLLCVTFAPCFNCLGYQSILAE